MRRVFRSPGLAALALMALLLAAATGVLTFAHAASSSTETAANPRERVVRLLNPAEPAAMRDLEDALDASPLIAEARALSVQDFAQITADAGGAADWPDPAQLRLFAIELAVNAPTDAAERLQADLAEAGFSVEIAAPSPQAARSAQGATNARFAALFAAALQALALALAVAWAAYLAAARRSAPARVLAQLGATRGYALARVSGPALRLGFVAGVLGVAGLAGLLLTLQAAAPQILDALLPSGLPKDQATFAILAAAPLAGALLARAGARAAISRAFDQESPAP